MLAERQVLPDRIRPLRRTEYEALVAQGLLDDTRVELLCGSLVEKTPQGPLHANVVRRLAEALVRGASAEVHVRVQMPLALSDDSEPDPDIAGRYTDVQRIDRRGRLTPAALPQLVLRVEDLLPG